MSTCPACGSGQLSDIEDINKTKYGWCLMVFSVCDTCGTEMASPEQIDKNSIEFKKLKERYNEDNTNY